jgi:hypothetical protein
VSTSTEGLYITADDAVAIKGTWTGSPVTGDKLGVQIDKILVYKNDKSDANLVNADGVRVWVKGKSVYDSEDSTFNFGLKLGIVSRFYNFDPTDLSTNGNLVCTVYFTIGGASSSVDITLENVYSPSGL